MPPLPSTARIVVTLAAFLFVWSCSRSTPQQTPPPKPPLEFIGEWGIPGTGPARLDAPFGIATDSVGNVYVADDGGYVHKFDPEGKPLLSFQDDWVKHPISVAVDQGHAIYVGDASGHLAVFFPDGKRLRKIGYGTVYVSRGLATDADGNLLVADPGRNLILLFDGRSRFKKSWAIQDAGPGQFEIPAGIAIDPQGDLYVTTTKPHLHNFNGTGVHSGSWEIPGPTEEGEYVAVSVAVSNKHLFCSLLSGPIQVWTLDGQHVLSSDLGGRLHRDRIAVVGMAISPRGELLLLDNSGPRVLRFRINL